MVENDDETVSNSNEVNQLVSVWFAKAVCFVRIRKSNKAVFGKGVLDSKYFPQNAKHDSENDFQKYDFLRYFKILQIQNLKVDKIDRLFGCICHRWHKTLGGDHILLPGEEFGLILAGAF